MHQQRLERITEAMRAAGARQTIVCDPIVIRWLTGLGIEPGERMLALLIREDGSHKLILNALFPQEETFGTEIAYYSDTDDGVALLASYMEPTGTVAVDKNWPARFLLRFMELAPEAKLINSAPVIDGVRLIKDADEQQAMIRASAVCDGVMAKLIEAIDGTATEAELSALTRRLFAEAGCEDVSFDPITAYAKNAADPHHTSDGTAARFGDCLVLDIGGKLGGYCSDMTRTVFLGAVSERQREIYEIVREANERGIAAAKPGNRMCDVDAACRDYIVSKGYGAYFTHRTGHSIGTEDHETGDVSSVNTAVIRPGQCFSVEPGIYLREEGIGVRVEDLVLITEDGCRVLNQYPKALKVLPFKGV